MELLPCPFCGGEALPTAHLTYNWFAPVCRRCNARGPSVKIERDSDPQEMRNLMNQADENWNRRASPASAPEGFKHDIGADRFTVVQGSYWWHVRAGEGTQNIGKFHTKRAAEEMALTLLTAFRDGAFMQYQAMLAAAPTPPVSEDRKDADRFREGWTHACNALCMEIALWIERCPHCGMPAPKAPAMQEDKQ